MESPLYEQAVPQLIRYPEVFSITGLSRSRIFCMVKAEEFPAPIKICGRRAVGWVKSEVVDWTNAAIANNRIGVEK